MAAQAKKQPKVHTCVVESQIRSVNSIDMLEFKDTVVLSLDADVKPQNVFAVAKSR